MTADLVLDDRMLDLVDRLVLLENGRVRADGPKAEVMRALSGQGGKQEERSGVVRH